MPLGILFSNYPTFIFAAHLRWIAQENFRL